MAKWLAIRERLRLSLVFIPAVFAVGAALLAIAIVALDHQLAHENTNAVFGFGGTAEGSRAVLSTIAQSMLTFTGLVFTITMLVLQLASSQLSPRVMRTFLRDRTNQVVLGLFVATFVYTLFVLREVRSPVGDDIGFVPALAVGVAFVLLFASVAAFIFYIDHMAHAIRASSVIVSIWSETAQAIDRKYGDSADQQDETKRALPDRPPDITVPSPRSGVAVTIDADTLVRTASESGGVLSVVPRVGDFVAQGMPLFRLWDAWDDRSIDKAREAVGFAAERTLDQDVAFGFRQLVDVATRALSPGTNDPTTAVQALDRIHDLLRRLEASDFPSGVHRDSADSARVVIREPTWDDYVGLGLDEIRVAGAGQIQIVQRMREILSDLSAVAPPDRQPPLRHQLALLDRQESAHAHAQEALVDWWTGPT
jgi:uncharacterized membrane protein